MELREILKLVILAILMISLFTAFPDISHISQNGLKKLLYNNKMTTYAELMEILKVNEIRGYSHYTK